jgi:hypothetical protein
MRRTGRAVLLLGITVLLVAFAVRTAGRGGRGQTGCSDSCDQPRIESTVCVPPQKPTLAPPREAPALAAKPRLEAERHHQVLYVRVEAERARGSATEN